jgi:hypothetical protein
VETAGFEPNGIEPARPPFSVMSIPGAPIRRKGRGRRFIAHGQREWFKERFREWTTAAGVKDPKATARALVVLFDGAVAGSEVDGPQRASDARWMAKRLLTW